MTESLTINAFVDASYGIHKDMKSHTGTVIIIGQGAIYAKSSKQKINTKSSTEAELVGISDSLNTILWLRNFIIEQGYTIPPVKLLQDNMSTINMVKSGKTTSERTRHIVIKFYFICDRYQSKEIDVEYIQTDQMIADALTKPLQGEKFRKFRNLILNIV